METTKRTLEEFNNKHKLKYDGQVSLAVGNSKTSKHWKNRSIMYSALVDKLSQTTRTPETYAEYKKMSKTDRDRIKDVGGFVGGSLKEGRRKAENVQNRTMLTLDLDYVSGDVWESIELLFDFAVTMYSTHTHAPDNQRLRLIIPLSRPVLPDEYQAIARMIANDLGIDQFDDTTYEPCRLMFWPSTSSDGEYVFKVQDLEWLNPDEVLNRYTFGWQDVSYWPESSRARAHMDKALQKQEDPLSKKGIIGAFCRTYSISEAIAEFLSEVYVPGKDETRYTYAEGSTSGGVVVYDDKFSYSHHGTDPASCILCNAFDLVRIHKFGELDDEAKKGRPSKELPSFKAMAEFAASDKNVLISLGEEKMMSAQEEFDAVEEEYDTEWLSELEYTEQGKLRSTISNFSLIIENEPLIKGKILFNEFTGKSTVTGQLPWRAKGNMDAWSDTDDSGLRGFIEKHYGVSNERKCRDGYNIVIENNKFNPVKKYFNALEWDKVPRLENLFITYLGAEDSEYTKAVTRKIFVAAVKRVFNPGAKFDTMLVLCGAQGIGKSTILRKMAITPEWYSDANVDINKDSKVIQGYRGKLIVEIAEMTGFSKKEIAAVKSFITRQIFEDRLAYARNKTEFKVQYVLFGTTNNKDCLSDRTGNRRFWILDVGTENISKSVFRDLSKNEIDQMWAEAVELYKKGESLLLDKELNKIATEKQEEHTSFDDIKVALEDVLDWKAPKEKWEYHTYTEICEILKLSERLVKLARNTLKPTLEQFGIVQELKNNRRVYNIPPVYYPEFNTTNF